MDDEGCGVLIHLDQEGRGNGLAAKIQALNGKEAGFDTFTAVERLGLPADNRRYDGVAAILAALDIPSVRLLTNNPFKVASVRRTGVVVVDTIPCLDPDPPRSARRHLAAKAERGHRIPPEMR